MRCAERIELGHQRDANGINKRNVHMCKNCFFPLRDLTQVNQSTKIQNDVYTKFNKNTKG